MDKKFGVVGASRIRLWVQSLFPFESEGWDGVKCVCNEFV